MFILNLFKHHTTFLIILEISVIISTLAGIIRLMIFGRWNFWRKFETPVLDFITKNNIIWRILCFCYIASERYFNLKTRFITKSITIFSSFYFAFGIVLRQLIILGYDVMPNKEILLFIVAVNAVFRSVISLGLLMSMGGLWKQFLERAGRSAPRMSSAMQHVPVDSNKSNNSNKQSYESGENNSETQNKPDWLKWGAIGALTAGGCSIVGVGFGLYDRIGEIIRVNSLETELEKTKNKLEKMTNKLEKQQ